MSSERIEKEREVLKNEVPIWHKYNLTIEEAALYFNIGICTLNEIAKKPGCPFVLYVGRKKLIKRKAFEDYLQKLYEI